MKHTFSGLRVAVRERNRINKYIAAIISGTENTVPDSQQKTLETFDACMTKVFNDYLEYLEHWVLLHHNTLQKSLLEEEFEFSLTVVKHIENGHEMLANKYANILGRILERSAERLLEKIDDFSSDISKEDVNSLK